MTATAPSRGGRRRLPVLHALFAFFNGARIVTYLPQIWAIERSGQSGQHSLLTWRTWLGANVTMALRLYEQNAWSAASPTASGQSASATSS